MSQPTLNDTVSTNPFGPPHTDVPDDAPLGIDVGRLKHLDEAFERFDDGLVREMADQTMRADELGYLAFKGFKDRSQNSSWAMFEQALEHGIDTVEDPSDSLVALFDQLDHVPDWVDWDQLERGAVAFWRGGPLVAMALTYSVIAVGFTGFGSTRPILFSARLYERDKVGRRLLESFRFIARAYTPGGMRRFEEGFKLTARVRMIHATVRHALSRNPDWNWAEWGIPINNLDAVDTQAGQFGVELIDSLARSGIVLTRQEREDVFALTRYVGYVMGVPEELMHTDEESARRLHDLHALVETPADDGARKIIHAIIDFSAEESLGGYEVLPPAVAKILTPDRRRALAHGLLYSWQPPEIAREAGIEPNGWRFVLPLVRPLLRGYDLLTRGIPGIQERRAARMLDDFDNAIAMADGETHALAEPEQLHADHEAGRLASL